MGMFDYVKVDPRLNLPGSDTATWQTKSGPDCMGWFKISPDECTYTHVDDFGGVPDLPTYKIMNLRFNFYSYENKVLTDYYADIVDGVLRSITNEDGIIVWSRPE